MKCERCKIEKEQIKAGKTKAESQKYKCKVCGKVYTPNPKERNYSKKVKKQAIKLYMEGNKGGIFLLNRWKLQNYIYVLLIIL